MHCMSVSKNSFNMILIATISPSFILLFHLVKIFASYTLYNNSVMMAGHILQQKSKTQDVPLHPPAHNDEMLLQ